MGRLGEANHVFVCMSLYRLLYVLLHLQTRDYAMAIQFVEAMKLVPELNELP